MFSEFYLSNYLYLFDIILLYMFKKYILGPLINLPIVVREKIQRGVEVVRKTHQ